MRYSRRFPGENRLFSPFLGKMRTLIMPATCSFHFGMRNPSPGFSARPNRTVSFWKRWRSRKTFRIDQGHQGCPRSPVWTPWRVRHAIWSSVRPDDRQNPRFQNPWYGNMFSVVNHQWSIGSNDPPQCRVVGGEKHWQPPRNDPDTGAGVGRRRSLPASRRRRGIPPRPHRRSGHPFAPAGAAQSGVRLWRKARKPAGTEKFGYAGTWDTQRSCVTEPHPLTDQDTKEGQTNHSPRLAPGRGDGSGAEVPWGI